MPRQEYPDYPDLTDDEVRAEMDEMLREYERSFSTPELSDDRSRLHASGLYTASLMHRFVDRVYSGEPVESWVMEALAKGFHFVLAGAMWEEKMPLPSRGLESVPDAMTVTERRRIEMYVAIANAMNGGAKVTHAIRDAATAFNVSPELARAAYYEWRSKLSKNAAKYLEEN